MPSRDDKIFWCLKQLFTSQFWPKTANFNLSETESLVFAIKRVFFFSYEHILGQPKVVYWQELFDGDVKQYVWHWFLFTIKHVKKLSGWSYTVTNKKRFVNFICFEHKTKGLLFFGQGQIISIVMENNFVYGVHMHNLSFYGRNAWKRKRKSKISCLLKKFLFVILFKKYYLKPKRIKTYRVIFLYYTFAERDVPSFSVFLVKIGYQSSPKKAHHATCWIT